MPPADRTRGEPSPSRDRVPTTMQRMRAWRGPALLSFGFRPFFLIGGAYAATVVLVWLLVLTGAMASPGDWPPLAWHAHELAFGFVPAVVAGFLLTAVPNWTGRLPVVGWPLLGLVAVWLAGRLAVAAAGLLPGAFVAALATAFPVTLAVFLGREILAGRNWRNLPVLGAVILLGIAQALFHAELLQGGAPVRGDRLGIAITVFLITLIGGRIVPSFTTNWLKRREPGELPVPFNRFDAFVIAGGALGLLLWALLPMAPGPTRAAGLLLIAGGALHLVRQARWLPWRTGPEPLVWVLHLAYGFVPLGFLLSGAGVLTADFGLEMAGLHAWAVGAIGLMTLAVMTRATRGHTGHALTAPPTTVAVYLAVALAALLRIAAALVPGWSVPLLTLAGIGWCAGFFGFVLLYGPMLIRRRA